MTTDPPATREMVREYDLGVSVGRMYGVGLGVAAGSIRFEFTSFLILQIAGILTILYAYHRDRKVRPSRDRVVRHD